jgi:hypothetical protein
MLNGVREADMPRLGLALVVVVLILHGLVHFIGTAVYLRLADIPGFAYKTTLLGGRVDLGNGGIRAFGMLWLLPAIGFALAALALLQEWDWWRTVLLAVTLLSLGLTSLDWSVAFAGAIVNIAILAIVWLGPRMVGLFS